ncbi:hypothetical protein Pla22_44150 [Rubripirellula amarantea]|uniref:Uncharacterized protein n=1 Tax=Rubripirellula amarantea TaxID=2527999 RepID=A0A5C5WGU1_9BACT|nr:hypothetical protein Pla22_44150 [Rubripirellula amarantea]
MDRITTEYLREAAQWKCENHPSVDEATLQMSEPDEMKEKRIAVDHPAIPLSLRKVRNPQSQNTSG